MTEKKDEGGEEKKNERQKMTRQLYWIFGVVAGILISFFVITFIVNSMKNFEYLGLTFTKSNYDYIPIYTYSYQAVVPASGTASGTQVRQVTLVLRGDPRENKVPFEGEVSFPRGKTIYVSTDGSGLVGCQYSTVGLASLSQFLTLNGFKVKGTTLNKTEANETKLQYVSCESHPDSPVIEITGGNETRINIDKNCYSIKIANCEVLPALEKLEVEAVAQAKARAE